MSKPHVLISGASIAGPALAFWLIRAGCTVTVVERASMMRNSGQGIDIRDAAREVVKRMGLFQTIRDHSSHEEGLRVVRGDDSDVARFGVDTSGKGQSFTSDVEILRGELAGILVDASKDEATYIFGDMVERLEETADKVTVHFANGTPSAAYDLVVAADGIGSKIRRMAMGADALNLRSLNSYISYFTIPLAPSDTRWSRVHWVTGGRTMVVRPDNVGTTRAFLGVVAYEAGDARLARFAEAARAGPAAQKALLRELFADADWERARLLDGMDATDDFYLQHVAQVRTPRWASAGGRVALCGDAGYAPSPFTGMGTSVALLGAYVLAGELSAHPGDIPAAMRAYERALRPHVEDIQKLAPGVPWILNPQTKTGIWVLETCFGVASLLGKLGVGKVLSKISSILPFGDRGFKLPEYEAFKHIQETK